MATTCPHCKAPITVASAKNCIHCGVVLPSAAPAAAGQSAAGQSAADDGNGGGFVGFVRDNWVWIVAPVVFAVIVVVVVMLVFGGEGDSSPFIYSIF
ncbi:MAG: hypothetical protein IT454_14000 [Planctomycetes bacterium]|nr:hypothetical protein [Planctomycetota bacterium]